MQLLTGLRGKTILLAGHFNQTVVKSICKEAELVYCYNITQTQNSDLQSSSVVAIETSELVDLPDGICDRIIISYALLFLDRIARVELLNTLQRLLKSGGELLVWEPADEVQKKNQQPFLDELKKIVALQKQTSLVLPSVGTICNLLENNGWQIKLKEMHSGSVTNQILPLPYINIGEEPAVHLLIRAVSMNNLESAYNIDSEATRLKPREKLLNGFIEEMKLHELLAVIIGMGNKQEDVFSMSERIIREYGSKALAMETDPKRLMEILAIGEANACKLVSAFEIGRRFYSEKVKGRQLIRGPEDVFKYAEGMSELVKENFRGLYLNTKNYIIHDEVISIGHLTASLVHPREVFKPAIEYSAAGFIVLHNHPSGDPEPSINDKEITEMLVKAGKTLGIPLLDHVIIGSGKYYSFNEKGMI